MCVVNNVVDLMEMDVDVLHNDLINSSKTLLSQVDLTAKQI